MTKRQSPTQSRRRLTLFQLVLLIIFTAARVTLVMSSSAVSYIAEKRSTKCIYLHSMFYDEDEFCDMFFVPMTLDEDEEVEDYYASYLAKIKDNFPRQRFPVNHDIPKMIEEKAKKYGKQEKQFQVEITVYQEGQRSQTINQKHSLDMKYHKPSIQRNVVANGDVDVCFVNRSYQSVKVYFTLYTFQKSTFELNEKDAVITKDHLDPLQRSLRNLQSQAQIIVRGIRQSVHKNKAILRTATSVYSRVSFFSYLSMFVLAATAAGQMYFLKYYFTKKKLIKNV